MASPVDSTQSQKRNKVRLRFKSLRPGSNSSLTSTSSSPVLLSSKSSDGGRSLMSTSSGIWGSPPPSAKDRLATAAPRADFRTDDNGVPMLVVECVAWLRQHAMRTEGILRVSGSALEVRRLQKLVSKGKDVSGELKDPHTCSSLLKCFLRDCEPPLVPYDRYQEFVDVASIDSEKGKGRRLREIVAELSPQSSAALRFMLDFGQEIARNSDATRMDTANVARMLAPCLLRSSSDSPETFLLDSGRTEAVMLVLVQHAEKVFRESRRGKRRKKKVAFEVEATVPAVLTPTRNLSSGSLNLGGVRFGQPQDVHGPRVPAAHTKKPVELDVLDADADGGKLHDGNGGSAAPSAGGENGDRDMPNVGDASRDARRKTPVILAPDASLDELLRVLDEQSKTVEPRSSLASSDAGSQVLPSASDVSIFSVTDSDEEDQLQMMRKRFQQPWQAPPAKGGELSTSLPDIKDSVSQQNRFPSPPARPADESRDRPGKPKKFLHKVPSMTDELVRAIQGMPPAPGPPGVTELSGEESSSDGEDFFSDGSSEPDSASLELEREAVALRVAEEEARIARERAEIDRVQAAERLEKARIAREREETERIQAAERHAKLQSELQQRKREQAEARLQAQREELRQREENRVREQQAREEAAAVRAASLAQAALAQKRKEDLLARQQERIGGSEPAPQPTEAPSADLPAENSEVAQAHFGKLEKLRDLILANVRLVRDWLADVDGELFELDTVDEINLRREKYRAIMDARRALEDLGETFEETPALPHDVDGVVRAKMVVQGVISSMARKVKEMLTRVVAGYQKATVALESNSENAVEEVDEAIGMVIPVAQAVRELSRIVEEQTDWESTADYGESQSSSSAEKTESAPPDNRIGLSLTNSAPLPERKNVSGPSCCVCQKELEGHFVTAEGEAYHTDCFTCNHCHAVIRGSFALSRLRGQKEIFCETHAHFASPTTYCTKCQNAFLPSDRIFSVDGHRVHNKCFICDRCKSPLDGVYIKVGTQTLCEACGDR